MKKILLLLAAFILWNGSLFAKTIMVKNETELIAANATAAPGDMIILKNGIWENISIKLTCNGSIDKPIYVKAETAGGVIIKGKSSLQIGGNWIVVDGLNFTEGYSLNGNVWDFRVGKQVANNCRITNCLIRSFNDPNRMVENYWVAFYGKNNRIDHNNFIDKTNLGVLVAVLLDDDRSRLNSHKIDSNYFGLRKPLGSNAGEIIRIGVAEHCTFYSNTQVVNNLFEHCDGETEVISIKSCGNLVRNNVFKECQGAVVLRHGNNNTIESNLFLGNGKEGSGGVRVINEGNWIVNNFFSNCKGEGFRSPLALMNGVFNSPPKRYLPVRDAVIANNTFVNCTPFSVCEGSDSERTVSPQNVYILNNLFYSDKPAVTFQYFDKLDGIYFKNNVVNEKIKKTIDNGFDQKTFFLTKLLGNDFPSYTASKANIDLPDSIKNQVAQRLQIGFKNTIGCAGVSFIEALEKQSHQLGMHWNEAVTKVQNNTPVVVNCKDAAAVYQAINSKASNLQIVLTGTNYLFDHPINLINQTAISSLKQNIRFQTNSSLPYLFKVAANKRFELLNCMIDAKGLQAKEFIMADSTGECIHFTIAIKNCTITNLTNNSFLKTGRSAYADSISIHQTTFSTNTTTLFCMNEEPEKKGYYNVEKLIINECVIENQRGMILGLYRTGVDESTMGPKLFFTNNRITNSGYNDAMLDLFGVQESLLQGNQFTNVNFNNTIVRYTDNVRGKHLQQNNSLQKSGKIEENKFVTNLQ